MNMRVNGSSLLSNRTTNSQDSSLQQNGMPSIERINELANDLRAHTMSIQIIVPHPDPQGGETHLPNPNALKAYNLTKMIMRNLGYQNPRPTQEQWQHVATFIQNFQGDPLELGSSLVRNFQNRFQGNRALS